MFLSNDFDVVGERKQLKLKKMSDRSREERYEIRLRNRREKAAEVVAIERLWGDWKIAKATHEYRQGGVRNDEVPLAVPPDGETVLRYTVPNPW